jgi:hypothetical protein
MLKRVLSAGIAILSLPVLAGQDPSLNLQYAAPDESAMAGLDTFWSSPASPAQRTLESKRVSAKFNQANAREIVGWLISNGVNFVVNDEDLPAKKSISMNLVDQPLGEVLQAIGTALEGRFVRRGEIYVFRPGINPMEEFEWTPGRTPRLGSPMTPMPPLTLEQRKQLEALDGKVFRFDFDTKELERTFKDLDKKFNSEEFRKNFRNLEMKVEGLTPGLAPGTRLTFNVEQLLKSLSKAQKEKHAKQGFLMLDDLTPEQRKFIGGGKEIDIEIRRDGETYRFKSAKKA